MCNAQAVLLMGDSSSNTNWDGSMALLDLHTKENTVLLLSILLQLLAPRMTCLNVKWLVASCNLDETTTKEGKSKELSVDCRELRGDEEVQPHISDCGHKR